MAHERLRDSGLVQALTDLFADLADLLQKELQLAKTEITEKLVSRLRASVWMVVAGVLGMIAVLLLIEAAVFGIASFGLALHWSCLIVAGVLIAAAAAAFFQGRAVAEGELLPTRAAKQISQDIKVAKEQLT
jgi:Putative Actinobacterial Holin-X, holin superfamily III